MAHAVRQTSLFMCPQTDIRLHLKRPSCNFQSPLFGGLFSGRRMKLIRIVEFNGERRSLRVEIVRRPDGPICARCEPETNLILWIGDFVSNQRPVNEDM